MDETKDRASHPPPTAETAEEDHDRAAEDEGDDREVQRDDEVSEPTATVGVAQEPFQASAPCPNPASGRGRARRRARRALG